MLVIRCEIAPVQGEWKMSATYNMNVAVVVMEPATDVEVEISRRKGWD